MEEENVMLIYCHPGSLDTHFMKPIFDKISDDFKITKRVSVDNWDVSWSVADYKEDGFSDSFFENHRNEFKVVFVPDCSGPWYTYQNQNDRESMYRLIQQLKTLIKPGGAIYFGKWVRSFDGKMLNSDLELEVYRDAVLENDSVTGPIIRGVGTILVYFKPELNAPTAYAGSVFSLFFKYIYVIFFVAIVILILFIIYYVNTRKVIIP